ncbi:MAG: histidine kinase [Verrucomicrobiota bacterium]|nr:histidine kinase [Verrucomicrobiota bacterium]
MTISDYLKRSALDANGFNLAAIDRARESLQAVASRPIAEAEVTANALDLFYSYPVPELSANGSCSLVHTLARAPYDLAQALGGRSARNTESLVRLHRLINQVQAMTGVGWMGIYQARRVAAGQRALVKLAYYGAPSRAEFPLNPDFARLSNNSTVGLTGRACIIGDVSLHTCEGNPFYVCDARVQSEACLPILNEFGETLGIIDAESFEQNTFGSGMLVPFIAFALEAPAYLP